MLPVATTVLCGLKPKQTISAVWPLNVWKHFPLSVLHNLHVLSNEPVAILSLFILAIQQMCFSFYVK
jgi:hypothetical protein